MKLFFFAALLASALPLQAATIDLSAEASRSVANDQVQAVLFVEESGQGPEIARRVNERIAQALALGKRYTTVRMQSAGSRSYPIYGKSRRIESWRMRSDLQIESSDSVAVAELIGKLQQDMLVESVNATPSRAVRSAAEKELLVEAIQAFRDKARLVATTLGTTYSIKSMSVNHQGVALPRGPMMMSVRAMAADAAPMPIEAGESQMAVQVSGQIQLPD